MTRNGGNLTRLTTNPGVRFSPGLEAITFGDHDPP